MDETEVPHMDETECRRTVRPKRRKPGFHEDMFKETSYYFKDGFRYVYPYAFTFTAYVKKRWFDLTLIELFKKEFHLETVGYYKRAIKSGKIKVNHEMVTEDLKLTNGDILTTLVHRHEPPVIHQDLEFLRNDEEMVVINKPSSIPVHPCGRYRHNSIVFLLGKEHNLHGLHTIHRLDRLTSGVLMFAKTSAKAKEIEHQLHEKQCIEKEYFARVVGEFPDEEISVDEPVLTASHKIGVCHVHEGGKTCSTKFKRLSFNGKSSVVSCKPRTGRMHQIRVHLKWLGYPIVNDPIYNHPTAWGDTKRKNDINEVIMELLHTRKDKSYGDELSTDKDDSSSCGVGLVNDKDDLDVTSNHKRIKIELPENVLSNEEVDAKDKISENDCIKREVSDVETTETVGSKSSVISHADVEGIPHTSHASVEENDEKGCTDNVGIGLADCMNVTGVILNTEIKIEITENTHASKEICETKDGNNVNVSPKGNKEKTEQSGIGSDNDERVSYTSRDIGEEYVDNDCTDCKRIWKRPLLSEMVMYLHAWRYKGLDWEYETSVPDWAKEDWIEG